MAEWLVEAGIGETRAALVEGTRILEARILPDGELVAGTILEARLVARIPERNQGIVAWAEGEALITPLPAGVTQGALTLVEITRPATPEPGKPKRARARPAAPGASPTPVRAELVEAHVTGTPFDALMANGGEAAAVHALSLHGPDRLAAAGWAELLEEAATGTVAFPGGALSIHLTPAMTLIDVDGLLAPSALAFSGARAAAQAIRRLDIAGSIGIDLPHAGDKQSRQAAAQAIDDALPQPFERTAVNGFGFVQIVRPRTRRSMPELYAMEPALAHARALLRIAERTTGAGPRTLAAHPAVIAAIEAHPAWIAELTRRIGASIVLRADATLSISGGHAQAQHP